MVSIAVGYTGEIGYTYPHILTPPTTKAGGTHPTGMLPCFVIVNTNVCIQFRTTVKSMRTKNPSHNAFKFEVGEENRIVHESLY